MATKSGHPTIAELAGLEEVIAGLRQCLDELREQVKALTAQLEQSQQISRALAEHLADARERERALEAEASRLRGLEADVKTVVLYLSSAVDETLARSETRFARDGVTEALVRILEALADD